MTLFTRKIPFLCLHLALYFSCQSAQALIETIAPGVTYEFRSTDAPLSIHILEVDPQKSVIAPARALNDGLGREPVSSIAERVGAIAAINGGFFKYSGRFDGQSMSVLKIDGNWFSLGKVPRAAIGWKKDFSKIIFNRIDPKVTLTIQQKEYPIDQFNGERDRKGTALYTWAFHRSTLTSPSGCEVIIQDGKIKEIFRKGDSDIPRDGYVYSIGKSAKIDMAAIQKGMACRVAYKITPLIPGADKEADWLDCDYIVGGTPLLIKDGQLISHFDAEFVRQSFLKSRHARSAIGIKEDGRWVFVVVDGRDPFLSVGMTMQELAEFMQSLGCINAINFDGGGSATMTIGSQVINFPDNTDVKEEERNERSQRPVSDAIVILPKEEVSKNELAR